MTTITVTFDPPVPSDDTATFNSKAFSTLGDLNTWSGQANTVAGEVNSAASAASSAAGTATTQAGIATGAAGTATTKAGDATAAAAAAAASAASITAQVSTATHGATDKATPVDADEIPLADSAATFGLKKLTWANLKATIKTYLSGVAFPIGGTTPSTGAFTALSTTDNVSVGVTPSAWGANWKAIDSGTGSAFAGFVGGYQTWMFANAYADGASTYKYKATSTAGAYQISGNVHAWLTAASGTAGNAITFNTAMTLDSSTFHMYGSVTYLGSTSTVADSDVYYDHNNVYGWAHYRKGGTQYGSTVAIYGSPGSGTMRSSFDAHEWYASNGSTFRMTLDASGHLLHGRTATGLTNAGAGLLKNAGGSYLEVVQGSTGVACAYFNQSFGSGTQTVADIRFNNTQVGTINVTSTATTYNTSSDQRLKENIVDADSASALFDSLQVRKFDWKVDGSHQRFGFIAQELAQVAPEAVYQPEDPEAMMAVDYSKLVPMLVKEIQSLRSRIAALEAA